jgi:hypothetical protein
MNKLFINMNIKKIIKEEIDDFNWVNELETPLSWLIDNFGDLKPVVRRGDKTFYIDNKKEVIFYYYQDEENGYCYISYSKIWTVLKSRFGFNNNEITKTTIRWLDEVYGLTGLTPGKSVHQPLQNVG